jgi:membrane-bound inhibitor of C-type lysozyme
MSQALVAALAALAMLADGAGSGASAAAGGPPLRIVATYGCSPTMSVTVVYDNAAGPDGQADVTLGGRIYKMDHVMSASGAKYTSQQGRTDGMTLTWWNKGRDGSLYEGKAGGDDLATLIATCSEKR